MNKQLHARDRGVQMNPDPFETAVAFVIWFILPSMAGVATFLAIAL